MTKEKQYIDKALEELKVQSFETTKQYLAVINLFKEGKNPIPARINLKHTENLVAIYFEVPEERFFFVVNLTKDPNIEVQGVWVQSGHRVYLTATSESLSYSQLASFLKLQPLTGWSIGDLRPSGNTHHTFSRISFEPNPMEAYDLEEKLNELLDELEQDKEGLKKLIENSNAYISVCRYQYVSENAGLHLDQKTIHRLSNLNLSIDVDAYIVGERILD